MRAHAVLPALRVRVGHDGLVEVHGLLGSAQDEWKVDVERRLSEEVGGLRVEMAQMRSSLLRWMFVFWIGQLMTMLIVFGMILLL